MPPTFAYKCSAQFPQNSFALTYKGEPFLIAENPVIFKALRAFATAWIHGDFFPRALLFLLTILPYLFLMRSFEVRPPTVFSLLPRSTMALAIWPLAILLTDFFFIAFMAFMAAFFFMTFMAFMAAFFFITFIAFMAAFFFITFMAFMAAFFFITFMAFMAAIFFITFIAFIALAMVMRKVCKGCVR